MEVTNGFEFEPRKSENLPENWDPTGLEDKNEISWFLNAYRNKDCTNNENLLVHVQATLKEIERF